MENALKCLFAAIITLLLICAVAFLAPRSRAPCETESRELVVHVLRSLPRFFLVLQSEESLVFSHCDRSTWLLGARRGQSVISVRVHWGVDLQKITQSDVSVANRDVRIRLPNPEILEIAPDMQTWRYTGKRSGLHLIADAARGTSLEQQLMRDGAVEIRQLRTNGFGLDKDVMLARVNRQAGKLFEGTGLNVRFE